MLAKVVIIEDNPATIRSLVKTIDWDALGCQVAGTAPDGEQGRQLILSARPDILLTDIRMPHKDGLQMLLEVREAVPDCKVIIITGYDQFQYASQAIKLAVFDYILKPIRNGEVIQAVRRALDMRSRQQEKETALALAARLKARTQLLSLLTNDSRAGQAVHQMLSEAGLQSPAYYLMILQPAGACALPPSALSGMDDLLDRCEARAVTVILYDSLVAYVMLAEEEASSAWERRAEALAARVAAALPVQLHIGFSLLNTSHHQIRQAYQQARQALWESALGQEPGGCCFYGRETAGPQGGAMAEMRRKVDELTASAELTEASASRAAGVLLAVSGQQYSNLRALVSLYALLLCKKFPCPMTEALDRALCAAWFVTSEREVGQCLAGLYAALRAGRAEAGSKCSLLTRNVLAYIRLHGAEPLRLSDVAEKHHVSVNYLSALIRRETGTTFHEHVLKAKMEIARTLLADPRILVEEVARAVGYDNYVSFYNAFKRLEHMTPTEYRNGLAEQK